MILLRCPKFRNGIGPRCAIRPVGTFVPAERGTALKTACYICHWQRCAVFPAASATGSARIAPLIAPPYSDSISTVDKVSGSGQKYLTLGSAKHLFRNYSKNSNDFSHHIGYNVTQCPIQTNRRNLP